MIRIRDKKSGKPSAHMRNEPGLMQPLVGPRSKKAMESRPLLECTLSTGLSVILRGNSALLSKK